MRPYELREKAEQARRKLEQKLDFDKDGDFDKDDLRTKDGKVFALAVIACGLILLFLVFK